MLATTVILAAASMSRIVGPLWYWLVIWAWTITALMAVSIVWSMALLIDKASADDAGGNTRWTPAYMRMAAPDRVESSFVHDMLEATQFKGDLGLRSIWPGRVVKAGSKCK